MGRAGRAGVPGGAVASHPLGAAAVREQALGLLDELAEARHGVNPRTEQQPH
ncbi:MULTISPECIES: hypothetical protein [unclassified Streptomyces]|uniref:hypothetical protein n=1 Tax=unclassified Streptomyces TaxID=2593676 RepID=UPI001369D7F9|nr:hypothetical protein [Streptomyces sp. YIM 132580]MXG26869.1 hypothetical protein [Streptomyces sp. YIM 132580]